MTIFGQETIAELKDLVAAKDYTLKQLKFARDAFKGFSAADASDWDSDFDSLSRRYSAARVLAQIAIGRAAITPLSNDKIPAPIEWDAVVHSIRQDPDHQTKGDLQDLSDRLTGAGGKPDYSKTPQPVKGSDADLEVFKQTDTLIRKGESAAKTAVEGARDATPWIVGVVLGLLAIVGFTRR